MSGATRGAVCEVDPDIAALIRATLAHAKGQGMEIDCMPAAPIRRRAVAIGLTGILCAALAPVGPSHAESGLIVGPIPNVETVLPLSIAIPNFVTADPQIAGTGTEIARSIGGILERSGGFRLVESDDVDDRDAGIDRVPRFPAWASRNVDILVTGAITRRPDNRLQATMRVWTIRARQQMSAHVYFVRDDNGAALGPAIAQDIYERLREHQR